MPTRSGKNFAVAEPPKSTVQATPSTAIASHPPQRATKHTQPDSGPSKPHLRASNKRQKKSNSPLRMSFQPIKSRETFQPTLTKPATMRSPGDNHASEEHNDTTQRRTIYGRGSGWRTGAMQKADRQSKPSSTKSIRSQSVHIIDLTQDGETDEDRLMHPPETRFRNDDDLEAESGSRYSLNRRQPGQARRVVHLAPQLSAELLIGEQDDFIQPGVRVTNDAGGANSESTITQDDRHDSLHDIDAGRPKQLEKKKVHNKQGSETRGIQRERAKSRAIMFTVAEAIAALAQAKNDASTVPTVAYDLPTGAFLTYPVERSYHLGAMGRYGAAIVQSSPRDYIFDWGVHAGKRITEVPPIYIEQILSSPRLEQLLAERLGLRGALNLRKPGDSRLKSGAASRLLDIPSPNNSYAPSNANPAGPHQHTFPIAPPKSSMDYKSKHGQNIGLSIPSDPSLYLEQLLEHQNEVDKHSVFRKALEHH